MESIQTKKPKWNTDGNLGTTIFPVSFEKVCDGTKTDAKWRETQRRRWTKAIVTHVIGRVNLTLWQSKVQASYTLMGQSSRKYTECIV